MSSKAHCPQPWGERVGGVNGEPARVTRRSNPLRCSRRNGGRHPDSLDAVSLRGLAEECESRSVRLVWWGLVPSRQTHRRQRVSSGRMRRGTSSACAKRTHSSRRRLISASSDEDTSFTRSRDPCTSIGTVTLSSRRSASESQGLRGGASALISRSGKPTKVGANRHRGLGRRTNARLAARHRSFEIASNRVPEEVVRDA